MPSLTYEVPCCLHAPDSQGLKGTGGSPEKEKLGEESLEDQELGERESNDETIEPNTDFQEQSDPTKDVRTACDLIPISLENPHTMLNIAYGVAHTLNEFRECFIRCQASCEVLVPPQQ